MYVTMAEIAKRAMEGGYGVTAPNVYDEFSVTAAISAAEELNACLLYTSVYRCAGRNR